MITMLKSQSSLLVLAVTGTVLGSVITGNLNADTLVPPQNLMSPPAAVTDSMILLLWDKPNNMDQASFSNYCIFQDGKLIGETAKGGFNVTGLEPDTSYTFMVKAKDTSGVLSAASHALQVTTEPKGEIFDITQYGAVGDGETVNTQAIQKAIDACTEGGTVLIPKGTFLSGALFLKSNMTLHVVEGGTLKGTTNLDDYKPFIESRFEGWDLMCFASLLNAGRRDTHGPPNVFNIKIIGQGTIDGSGGVLDRAQAREAGIRSRGRLIHLINTENVYVHGLSLSYGPGWTNHAIYSKNLTFSQLKVISRNPEYRIRNGDGIGIDSSSHVYIFDNYFRTGDDSIAVKSGKNLIGYEVGRPSTDIRITNNVIDGSMGGIVIGSEMSGGVRNVLVSDCTISGISWEGLDIKSNVVRGGTVENIVFRDITLSRMRLGIRLTMDYSVNNDGTPAPRPPVFRNIRYENIRSEGGVRTAIQCTGLPESRIQDVVFKNVHINADNGCTIKYCENITFEDTLINDSTGPFTVSDSDHVKYISNAPPPAERITWAGVRSSGYGIRPFPDACGWTTAMNAMADYFPGSTTAAIWLVGGIVFDGLNSGQRLEFPNPGGTWDSRIHFSQSDKHEPYLNYFDEHGIAVFLQFEPGFAPLDELFEIAHKRYGHHPCVAGFGVDVEWFESQRNGDRNTPVDDTTAQAWEAKVKSLNPDYRLILRHFRTSALPPAYRGDIIFICNSQQHRNYERFLNTMADFADFFKPADVMFQIGYPRDKPWWENLSQPIPKTIGQDLKERILHQNIGIIWVDFSLADVLPTQCP
ncbi:MAG TPA: glycoside hydrolase family 28 protein [Phycisphaerales bacterium]|nr:glycoside hydrolase family 28 protein [Phycisphaerales bacterium]